MAKKITGYIKLQLPAGEATPGQKVGTALGPKGLNIMEFCKVFNAMTQNMEKGMPIPVIATVYSDKSFSLVTKTPPAANLLLKAVGAQKGSATPNKTKIGKITMEQIENIVNIKFKDLTAATKKTAVKTILGTAKSMGIELSE